MKYKTLTKSEMKNVLGGAGRSSHCPDGQKLYNCEQVYEESTTYGVICAGSYIDAELGAMDGLITPEQVTCW